MRAGTLVVDIAANVARLQQDMAQAKGVVSGAMNEISRSANVAKNALGALGVGLSVGALAMMAKNTIAATAALDDMAEATGASVEKLSRLSVVARVHGADMNLVQDGLVRLTRGLKGTEEETQNATAALAALGIQTKTAAGQLRDPGELMQEIAGKLATFRDGAGKTAIALDLFGKSGAKLLPYLKDLATAGEYGGRVTGEQAAQAEQLENNMRRLTVAAEEAKRTFMIGLTPALLSFTEQLNDAYKAAGNLASALLLVAGGRRSVDDINADIASIEGKGTVRKWFENAGTMGLGGVVDQARLSLLYRQRDYQLAQLGRNAVGLEDDLSGTMRGPDSPGVLNYTGRTDTAKAAAAAKKAAAEAAKAAKKALEEYDKALEQTAKNEEALTKAREEGAAVEAEASLKRGQALIAGYALAEQIEFETTLIGKSNAEREVAIALRELETSGIKKTDEAYAGLAERMGVVINAKVAREEAHEAAKAAAEEWKREQKSMWESIDRTAHDTFVSIFESGKGAFERLRDTLKNTLYDLLYQMTLRPFVIQIAAAVTGSTAASSALAAGGSLLGGGGGGGIGGGSGLMDIASLGSNLYSMVSGNSLLSSVGGALGFGGGAALSGAALAAEAAALTGSGVAVGGALGTGAVAASSVLPWVGGALAIGGALGIFGGGGLFGGKKEKKPADMYLSQDESGRYFIWGDDVPGPSARSDFSYLEPALNDPLQYDPAILATVLNQGFRGDVGERADSLLPKFLQMLEPARQSAQASVAGWQAKLLGTGGAFESSLAGYVGGMTVSEYLAPEQRFAGAQRLYDDALARAGTGDAAASAALPGLGQQLLGAGRTMYASGEQFQDLLTKVNSDLASVLQQQADAQAAVMAEIPAAILQANQDQLNALTLLRKELAAGLDAINRGLRMFGQGPVGATT